MESNDDIYGEHFG